MRPDKGVRLTNSFDDYLKAMGPVDKVLAFGTFQLPVMGPESGVGFSWGENVNDIAAALIARAPDKVIGCMAVHPNDVRVMEEIDRCAHELGLRGIKLGPNYQNFDPL